MRIIGVTGPSGAGKSLLCDYFNTLGIPTINADEVYHGLLVPQSECLDALTEVFGMGILNGDGELCRAALSEIVFHDESKLKLLNETVLGFVLEKIREIIAIHEKAGASAVIVDAPTLIESGFHKECNTVISVLCPKERRIERIMERDGISNDAAKTRVDAQKPDSFYEAHSSIVLTNDKGESEFLKKAQELIKILSL